MKLRILNITMDMDISTSKAGEFLTVLGHSLKIVHNALEFFYLP